MNRTCFLAGILFAATWTAATIEPDLYWSFDKGVGADNGKLPGILPWKMDEKEMIVPGLRGNALKIGASDNLKEKYFVRYENKFSSAEGSFACWLKPVNWNGDQHEFHNFIRLRTGSAQNPEQTLDFYRYRDSAGGLLLRYAGKENADKCATGISITDWKAGQWNHFVITWNAKELVIYLNGKRKMEAPSKIKGDLPFDLLELGTWFGGKCGETLLDELYYYSRALTLKDVDENYNRAAQVFAVGKTRLLYHPGSKRFSLLINNAPVQLDGVAPVWTLFFYDEKTRQANTRPLHGRVEHCQEPWSPSQAVLTADQAKLESVVFNRNTGEVIFNYTHPKADVQVTFTLKTDKASIRGFMVNHADDPVCNFSVCPGIRFQMGPKDSIIAPDPMFYGVEYSHINNFSWGMCYAWDGFLLKHGNEYFAVDDVQDIDKVYYAGGAAIVGDVTGRKLTFSNVMHILARKGERRNAIEVHLQNFSTLRQWADNYLKLNFPRGVRTLREKMGPETFRLFAGSYLAPGWGPIPTLIRLLDKVPGTYILHTPDYMRPPRGNTAHWDAFPNYFPPRKEVGTLDDYKALIQKVRKDGNIFMPRTSFFYWVDGSDFDLQYGLANNAIIRIDGKPRTANWSISGYLMSPSSKVVRKYLDQTYDTWHEMGANAYFTNVICAIDPYGNRYDSHPDAPATDLLYNQLYDLMKYYGLRLPLYSEGGGLWQIPYQAGFTGHPGWIKEQPVDTIRTNPKRVTFVRAVPEVPLMLDHEYVSFHQSNTGYQDAAYSIRRLSYILVNGFSPKCGLPEEEKITEKYRFWLRTTALLAREIFSELFGARLESYERKGDVVTADYAGAKITANFSDKEIDFRAGELRAKIAPDGYGFASKDGKKVSGYFSELNGEKLSRPELFVFTESDGKLKAYTPLTKRAVTFSMNGIRIAMPGYPAVIDKKIPGATADLKTKKVAYDQVRPDLTSSRPSGYDRQPEAAAASFPAPLLFEWKTGMPLPASVKQIKSPVTPEGLCLKRNGGSIHLDSPEFIFKEKLYIEMIFRYDRQPEEGRLWGDTPLLRPDPNGPYIPNRTFELRYNIYNDRLCFMIRLEDGAFVSVHSTDFTVEPGKFYHLTASYDGQILRLVVNGKTVEKKVSGKLKPNVPNLLLGDIYDTVTFSLIRIAGK